jgi:MFS family permease
MKTFFYGWTVTACAFVVLFLTYGVQYSFGVFVPAMVDDLGWQRASLGGAFSLYSVVYTSFSLISGRLTDSLGPRRVISLGGVLLGFGLIATSQMSAHWQLFFCYGIVAALGMSTSYIPCNMTVVRWFQRKRGLALGIASCGASCGILVVPILASLLITTTDWRIGLFALIGSVSLGTLSDRIGRKAAINLGLAMQIVAFVLFLDAGTATALYIGAAAFGFFYGSFASLFPALVGDLFGTAHAGAIGGFLFGGAGVLGAWGPALAGYLRDLNGDFRLAFLCCLLASICTLVLFVLLPKPRRR